MIDYQQFNALSGSTKFANHSGFTLQKKWQQRFLLLLGSDRVQHQSQGRVTDNFIIDAHVQTLSEPIRG